MFDLMDVTFNIPVKIDQPNRGRNLNIILNYIKRYMKTTIIICEMDEEPKAKQYIDVDCKYIFMKTKSQYIHRTMMLNYMANISTTPIIVNYDVDVLFPPESYLNATEIIRRNESKMVFPFDGTFWNIPNIMIERIKDTLDVMFINTDLCQNLATNFKSVGGAIFWDKKTFIDFGMENENFVSWGHEDQERAIRAKILEVPIARVENPLYHLCHQPSLNSSNSGHVFFKQNENEFNKVKNMSKDDLLNYISTWKWLKKS
jgi:hypothetical protein